MQVTVALKSKSCEKGIEGTTGIHKTDTWTCLWGMKYSGNAFQKQHLNWNVTDPYGSARPSTGTSTFLEQERKHMLELKWELGTFKNSWNVKRKGKIGKRWVWKGNQEPHSVGCEGFKSVLYSKKLNILNWMLIIFHTFKKIQILFKKWIGNSMPWGRETRIWTCFYTRELTLSSNSKSITRVWTLREINISPEMESSTVSDNQGSVLVSISQLWVVRGGRALRDHCLSLSIPRRKLRQQGYIIDGTDRIQISIAQFFFS